MNKADERAGKLEDLDDRAEKLLEHVSLFYHIDKFILSFDKYNDIFAFKTAWQKACPINYAFYGSNSCFMVCWEILLS